MVGGGLCATVSRLWEWPRSRGRSHRGSFSRSSRSSSGLPQALAIHSQYTVLYLGLAPSSSFLEAADPTERLEADLGPRPGLGAASVLACSSWPSRAEKSAEEASLCRCLGLARHRATCNSQRLCGRVASSIHLCLCMVCNSNNSSVNQFLLTPTSWF